MTDMKNGPEPDIERIAFYACPEYDCNYLAGRRATLLFVEPAARLTPSLYTRLAENGFRRSGEFVYRPHCRACQACVPVRLPVDDYVPARRERRILRRNADLAVSRRELAFHEEHFDLYRRYIKTRHPGGGMELDVDDADKYLTFLQASWSNSCFYEFRESGRLLAVAVVDGIESGLSAVYTYFEPDETPRSPGTYAVLWLLEEARRLGLGYVYLGYWIGETRKMRYKSDFRPLEVFVDGVWRRVGKGDPMPGEG